jgi:hypothetical protein
MSIPLNQQQRPKKGNTTKCLYCAVCNYLRTNHRNKPLSEHTSPQSRVVHTRLRVSAHVRHGCFSDGDYDLIGVSPSQHSFKTALQSNAPCNLTTSSFYFPTSSMCAIEPRLHPEQRAGEAGGCQPPSSLFLYSDRRHGRGGAQGRGVDVVESRMYVRNIHARLDRTLNTSSHPGDCSEINLSNLQPCNPGQICMHPSLVRHP